MEIKKFVSYYYENTEEFIFVKDGEDKFEIEINDDGSEYFAEVTKNRKKITSDWTESMNIYHGFNLAKLNPDKEYNFSLHLYDEDEGEAEQESFDTAVEAARNWLYN